jgi:hypothetical protein
MDFLIEILNCVTYLKTKLFIVAWFVEKLKCKYWVAVWISFLRATGKMLDLLIEKI